jgi:hypothetical protein
MKEQVASVDRRIGQCLIQAGIITARELEAALAEQHLTGEAVGATLVRLNYATEKQVARALAYQCGLAFVSLVEHPPELAAMALIPRDVAVARLCVGARLDRDLLTVAVSDPLSFGSAQPLDLDHSCQIAYVVATRSDIVDCIGTGYRDRAGVKDIRGGIPDFSRCPHGGRPVPGGCASCARLLEPDWSYCPFCAAPAEGLGSSPAM